MRLASPSLNRCHAARFGRRRYPQFCGYLSLPSPCEPPSTHTHTHTHNSISFLFSFLPCFVVSFLLPFWCREGFRPFSHARLARTQTCTHSPSHPFLRATTTLMQCSFLFLASHFSDCSALPSISYILSRERVARANCVASALCTQYQRIPHPLRRCSVRLT